uniref:mannitol 2-dehydrogenase n=1 Tax=Panagrolaimus superbus TaxID=310955 RepID=A0A914ZC88_9BILA
MSSESNDNLILHIGTGAFHRAHQAFYLHQLNQLQSQQQPSEKKWSLVAGNIRNDVEHIMDALRSQNGEYTLETITPHGEHEYTKIQSIKKICKWSPNLEELISVGANVACKIISFTVTEGGYYLDEHDKLVIDNPDIEADIGGGMKTIYGTIVAILEQRQKLNGEAITLQSCDNLRNNGARFCAGLMAFLVLKGNESLKAWIKANTTTPCSMVDRITPRPTADVAERVLKATGFADKCPVMGEAFIQWVIEDHFVNGRPQWQKVGVELVEEVAAYEEAKIRILNASHSCVAWAGTLIGLTYIHEDTANPDIKKFAYQYITDDVIPALSPSPINLEKYRDVVLDRFLNANLKDTNKRVNLDSYSKIAGFIVPTIADSFARGGMPQATALLTALFFRFLEKWIEGIEEFAFFDSTMDEQIVKGFFKSDNPIKAYCSDKLLWGKLSGKKELEQVVREGVEIVDQWLAAQKN